MCAVFTDGEVMFVDSIMDTFEGSPEWRGADIDNSVVGFEFGTENGMLKLFE